MSDEPENPPSSEPTFLDIAAQIVPRDGESYDDWRRRYSHFEQTGQTELPGKSDDKNLGDV